MGGELDATVATSADATTGGGTIAGADATAGGGAGAALSGMNLNWMVWMVWVASQRAICE